VPRYLRSGKYLPETATEILTELKPPPQRVFADSAPAPGRANYLRFRLSPARLSPSPRASNSEGSDSSMRSESSTCSKEQPGGEAPYERLLTDAMTSDGALFTREDAVEAAWAVVNPVLKSHTGLCLTSVTVGA
jgi:glucose-6-phosphate 1-dehydrogenase